MMTTLKRRKNQAGQAAIEFMAVVVVIFFFLLFFLSLSFLIVLSEYVDYATFMAARTYKSGFSKEATQESNAKLVFDKYFEKVQGLVRKPQIRFVRADPNSEQTAGMVVQYEADLFYMPPIFLMGRGGEASNPRINLQSEAHLGRDPTFNEVCDPGNGDSFFMKFLQNNGIQNPETIAEQMDDNGC